jgi:hypothetical protein
MSMDGVSLLPQRKTSATLRDPPSSSSNFVGSKASPTASTPRSARPSFAARAISAPGRPNPPSLEDDAYNQRDSVASLKDDPFFRNYQSPQSVSLTRQMSSATYNEMEGSDEELLGSSERQIENFVNLPV